MIEFAHPNDAKSVTPLMFQAMEEIVYKLIGTENKKLALSFLEELFRQENNQYSYRNTLVFKEKGEIIGSLVFYNGADLETLRKPVLQLASQISGKEISVENETQAGEIYIDTLSVCPSSQGKGIGSQLIRYLQNLLSENQSQKIGLLVDEKNHQAEKLYLRLGFTFQNTQTLAGGVYKHLVFEIKP